MANQFLFSIIMAIYNTGKYLDDSIGSLLDQTIGFKNIQLILVNDGSTDQTEEICLKYKKKYFHNIFYIKIEHGGVSKARNKGIDLAKGEYINFLDPDDKWDYKAFYYALNFFTNNRDINIVAGRLIFFEMLNVFHPLDYKFYKTRISNVTEEYNCIQLSASSSFFKISLLKNKYFEEGVFNNEDSLLINNILLYNPLIGFIKEMLYYYRKREDSSSSVQNNKYDIRFYFDTFEFFHNQMVINSKLLYNKTAPFIQFLLGYDILWRIKERKCNYIDLNYCKKYHLIIEQILKQIEDKYILEQRILSNKYKLFSLSKKYKKDLRYDMNLKNISFIYSNNIMIDLQKEKNIIVWRILDIKNSILHLEGIDNLWMPQENYFFFVY